MGAAVGEKRQRAPVPLVCEPTKTMLGGKETDDFCGNERKGSEVALSKMLAFCVFCRIVYIP